MNKKIGFDATCSLVILDDKYQSVSLSNEKKSDIIMWMDHRSKKQAEFINSTNHKCLQTVGGSISPEMDPPKILWLKENQPEIYSQVHHFFSLPDFLVWKSSGHDLRSVCTTTCKWLFNSIDSVWDVSFWKTIGLGELTADNCSQIGSVVKRPFEYVEELKISSDMMNKTGLASHVKIGKI